MRMMLYIKSVYKTNFKMTVRDKVFHAWEECIFITAMSFTFF